MIKASGVRKTFGTFNALNDFSINVKKARFTASSVLTEQVKLHS